MNKQTTYDEIPYESRPFPQSHPDRLATLGKLFGMLTPPVEQCNVLELGCAGGGNLIPMACQLAKSNFLGVDLSKRQVLMGQRIIDELCLQNINIRNASIMDIDSSWGQFDYILAHGVFSWVEEAVREKIISICSKNLTPNGIAYVSYNTYPGWRMREMIRDMMLYHSSQFKNTSEQIDQARALIDFISNAVPTENNHYGLLLKNELKLIRQSHDWYLFHDHMEKINNPLYFHQFAQLAEKYHLQYLGEADFSTMVTSGFPEKVKNTLDNICPNIIQTEQYMDFVRNRQFRQTLLCHDKITLNRKLGADEVSHFLIASSAKPESYPEDLSSENEQSFKAINGLSIKTRSTITKTALQILFEIWPQSLSVNALFKILKDRLHSFGYYSEDVFAKNSDTLKKDLLHCYAANVIEFHTWQANFTIRALDRPKVCKLAAYQAANSQIVVNQRHETVHLDAVSRHMVPLLDGTNDRAAIVNKLQEYAADGKITLSENDKPLSDSKTIRAAIEQAVENSLVDLSRSAMLVK